MAALFLKLGFISFGGPAAHIALMRREVVERRQWVDDQEFLDMVGATNLIPGPNSTEMAIHLGQKRAGWRGLLAAGALFILPAACIVLILAVLYVQYGSTPQVTWLLYGIKPVIIAIVAQALWALGRRVLNSRVPIVIGTGALALYFAGVNEVLLLLLAAIAMMLIKSAEKLRSTGAPAFALLPLLKLAGLPVAGPVSGYTPLVLFLNFLKIGSVLYGSGYVLLAFLRADFVDRLGWLTEQQLIDAVAVGQFTPGPVFTTATFVGYVVGGFPGAILATIGIFLPSFIFVALLSKILPAIRRTPWTRVALDGINVASLALMAGVTWQLGRASIVDWFTVLLAGIAVALVFRTRLNTAWLVLGGGIAGVGYKLLAG